MSARRIYHFGPYRLDAAERTLTRRGEPVPLTLKAFDTLLLLVERHGHTVRKEEILARVWPDSFVEEGVISVNIFTLRKCLAEDGTGFIQTVPKQGYRFVAPADEDDAVSLLRQQRPAAPSASKAIAVLPFRRLNADDVGRYLGLGIADALITRLSNLTNLIVRPTSAAKGDGAKAMAAVETALAMSNGGWIEAGILAHTLAAAGRRQEALDVLSGPEPAVNEEYVLPQIIAATYLQLADRRKALGWLEAAYSHHASSLMWLKTDPWFDDLRRAPEFLALLQRIGLASSP